MIKRRLLADGERKSCNMEWGYISEADIAHMMREVGFDEDSIAEFMRYEKEEKRREQVMLLSRQRQRLLDCIHADEKRIDHLDYFIYQLSHL